MSSIWTVRRSTTDVKVAGLSAGLARSWHIDPTLIRVGFAVLALSGGVGVVLYLAGWLLLPAEGSDRAVIEDSLGPQVRNWPREAWIAVVAVACIAAFAIFSSLTPFGIGPAVILAGIWYFGYYRTHRCKGSARTPHASSSPGAASTPGAPTVPVTATTRVNPTVPVNPTIPVDSTSVLAPATVDAPPTPFTQAAQAWQQRVNAVRGGAAGSEPTGDPATAPATSWTTYPSYPPVPEVQPATEPVPGWSVSEPSAAGGPSLDAGWSAEAAYFAHPDPAGLFTEPAPVAPVAVPSRRTSLSARRLRLATLAMVGLVIGGLALAENAGAAIPLAAFPAAALLVIALALVASAWLGRARGLLPVGLLLAFVVTGATVAGPILDTQNWQTATRSYATAAAIPAAGDQLDVGRLEVDLTKLPVSRDLTYTARVNTGSLTIRVPAEANVRFSYVADSGVVGAFNQEAEGGTDLRGTAESPGYRSDRPTLIVNASVGRGHLEVVR